MSGSKLLVRFLPRLLAVVALALAVVALLRFSRDRNRRLPAERFLSAYDVPLRRPAAAETLALAPSADLATNTIADIALDDALGTIPLAEASPQVQTAWLRTVERLDDELEAARNLTLDAAAIRPGWAEHWALLGKLVYVEQRRRPLTTSRSDSTLWQEPLRLALNCGPGDDSNASFAASAYLESWPRLGTAARQVTRPLFRRALLDSSFSARAFASLLDAVGHDEAIALLPPVAGTLRAAFDSLARAGDIAGASPIYERWQQAEWTARVVDLREIEERSRLNDVEKLRNLTLDWMSHHPATDFDNDAGRQQVVRVLQLTVNDRIGVWQSDPRAAVVRFLMNHRIVPDAQSTRAMEIAQGGAAVGAAVSALTGVPEPVRARARLFAGDVYGAESLFSRSDSAGSFEWTPFLLDVARFRLSQNMMDGASSAIESMAPAARNECDALIVRRDLARRSGADKLLLDSSRRLAASSIGSTLDSWSNNGMLSLCIDPESAGLHKLTTTLQTATPSLVSYGWNEGRSGTIYLQPGRTTLAVPLTGRSGRNTFFVHALSGPAVKPVETTITSR